MAQRLSPLDATFLELEQQDDSAHMHIGGALVLDPRPDGSVPTIHELRDHLDSRLGHLPTYRCRLSSTHTGGLRWPEWQEYEHFDIASHVRRGALPAPGGDAELCEWLGDYWSHRLDRTRPLWDMVVLEGLAEGRWVLATKTHHALVDGVGSMDVGSLLLDTEAERGSAPVPNGAASASPASDRGTGGQLMSAIRWAPEHLARAAARGAEFALHPDKAREMLDRSRATADVLLRDEVVAAPHSSLNCRIGATRRFAAVRVPLSELKEIKRALGGTINDVVLAAVTGGLRKLLLARGDAPPGPGLRAMVPMNVRLASEHLAPGNRVSSLFVHLPVAVSTPEDRYRRVVAEAEQLKSSGQGLGTSTIMSLAGFAPPALHATLARSLYATRLFNVTVTNVPGPQMPLYALGARMREILPLVPLAAEHAVGVAIVSFDGLACFGVNADAETVTDLGVLREGIAEELDALRELAAAPAPRRGR
jgi:WS/DGAT/MGAT family acyltransferase